MPFTCTSVDTQGGHWSVISSPCWGEALRHSQPAKSPEIWHPVVPRDFCCVSGSNKTTLWFKSIRSTVVGCFTCNAQSNDSACHRGCFYGSLLNKHTVFKMDTEKNNKCRTHTFVCKSDLFLSAKQCLNILSKIIHVGTQVDFAP